MVGSLPDDEEEEEDRGGRVPEDFDDDYDDDIGLKGDRFERLRQNVFAKVSEDGNDYNTDYKKTDTEPEDVRKAKTVVSLLRRLLLD